MALLRSGEGGRISAYENERLDRPKGQRRRPCSDLAVDDPSGPEGSWWGASISAAGEVRCGGDEAATRDCHAGTVLHLLAHTLQMSQCK